jgi:hypothetical protein
LRTKLETPFALMVGTLPPSLVELGLSRCRFSCCRFQNRERANTLRVQTLRPMETRMPGHRNILYLIIGALIVAVGVLGYNLYQVKKEPEGLQINVGPS